jgi:hypothetical protein
MAGPGVGDQPTGSRRRHHHRRPTLTDMAAHPAPTQASPQRVVLIGCAGSGKTTLARALAVRLGAPHIERDALGDDEAPGFATKVAAAVDAAGSRWVFDGAPYNAELVVYPARRHRGCPGLSALGRAAAGPDPLGPAVVDPPRRWGPHLLGAAVALVGVHPSGRLGHQDARHPARRDRRAVRTARVGPCSSAAVHLAPPGHRLAGQSAPLRAVPAGCRAFCACLYGQRILEASPFRPTDRDQEKEGQRCRRPAPSCRCCCGADGSYFGQVGGVMADGSVRWW